MAFFGFPRFDFLCGSHESGFACETLAYQSQSPTKIKIKTKIIMNLANNGATETLICGEYVAT